MSIRSVQPQKNWAEFLYRSVLLGVLVILSLFLEQGGLAMPIKDGLWQVLRPAWEGATQLEEQRSKWQSRWQLFSQGAGQLAKLEHERSQLQLQADRVSILERENNVLRQELSQKLPENTLLFRFYGSGSRWFIDGGSNQGVRSGQLIVKEGSLIGIVSTVAPSFSEVKTLWDDSWQLPVKVSSDSAVARGLYTRRRGVSEVIQMPRSFSVATDMPVLTLGSPETPPDLPLGRIRKVEENQDGATWNILMEPYFPPSHLDWVELRGEGSTL